MVLATSYSGNCLYNWYNLASPALMDYQFLLRQPEESKIEKAGEAMAALLAFVAVFLWLWVV